MHQVMLHETRTLQCLLRKKEMQIFIFATKLLSITPPRDCRSYEIVFASNFSISVKYLCPLETSPHICSKTREKST